MSGNNRETVNEVARRAANIENHFNSHLGYETDAPGWGTGEHLCTDDGELYTILDEFDFRKTESDSYQKAVVLQDKDGNIFFHFNGTGDGNW
ncbi:MAG: hypothetical protein ACI4J4_08280, partial [Ruminiclostridium sp.]